jgi:hypothetical protein
LPEIAKFNSGHGFINSLGDYIVTTDFEKYDEGVSMDDILKFANLSKAKDKIIILDCCHSGAFQIRLHLGKQIVIFETVVLSWQYIENRFQRQSASPGP